MSELQRALELELPIIQAPMAGVQDHALAVAVSERRRSRLAALRDARLAASRREFAALQASTDRPFNLNFFCHAQPVADAEREAAWRVALAPYYREARPRCRRHRGLVGGSPSPPAPPP